jgi:hypothetical protein
MQTAESPNESAIPNPQSGINPQSEIRNPKRQSVASLSAHHQIKSAVARTAVAPA